MKMRATLLLLATLGFTAVCTTSSATGSGLSQDEAIASIQERARTLGFPELAPQVEALMATEEGRASYQAWGVPFVGAALDELVARDRLWDVGAEAIRIATSLPEFSAVVLDHQGGGTLNIYLTSVSDAAATRIRDAMPAPNQGRLRVLQGKRSDAEMKRIAAQLFENRLTLFGGVVVEGLSSRAQDNRIEIVVSPGEVQKARSLVTKVAAEWGVEIVVGSADPTTRR